MGEHACRLLIVAESSDAFAWYQRALTHEHGETYQCQWTCSGQEALAICRSSSRPDGLILDIASADVDALDFLEQLKAGGNEPPLAVVCVAPMGSEATAIKAMKAGAHDYIIRHSGVEDLRRAVRSALERHSRATDRGFRVLIVDDSPEDRVIYRRRLSRGPEHYEFREAEYADEALALYRSFRPHCILLDYQLPDVDGLELLTALLREDPNHDVAILMLTGQGNESVAVRALKAGAEDYLVKGPALDGLPQAVRSAIEKVSLRRRLEQQRQELEWSRNQLRVTLASIGDAVVATDLEGRVTFLNPVAEQLTGWPSSEARGRLLEEVFVIVNEQTRQKVANPAARSLQEGVIVGLANHTILIARDGTEYPIDDSAAPIRNEAGEVFGAVLVFRDVTDRRESERSLLLQARVLDSMTEGVSVADEEGIIFYTNPAEDRMFGYPRGGLIGKHVSVQYDYPPEETERRVREVMAWLRAGGTWTGEWRNRRLDGSTFTSYARITTLDVEGRTCLVCVQEDVTERKRLEDELQRRLTDLALADRRKDEFLAMLAHELRNPLAPIKNSLHVLRYTRDDWKAVEQVREIMERQVSHMSRLIDDLLDVSRITQGKVTLRPERLDLATLVSQCVADHRSPFDQAGIHLSVVVPQTPVWITGDATRLTQVIDNFLTNARKFTNSGGHVVVTVDVAGDQARIVVEDDGIGIEPAMLPHIFDVFAQADKSLDRSSGGMGLGLAVVKGLVGLHGGTVVAESEGLGHGARMVVELPLQQELPALAPADLPRRGPAMLRKVLVVEDNVDSADSLKMLLTVLGFEVRVVHNGTEGAQAALEWQPDGIICDIGLPGLDGFAVARQVRENPATAKVRIIALTGYGREVDITAARNAGFDDLLVKPADPERLVAILTQKTN